ncbi:hypothetical protein M0811_12001 [Anaeramoeba ignava]|uniref:Uncharacterized protein n=1 Tax=Anaeramoeba ignava TaxID=1746090 RepID=A0A9Q0R6F8_ANAIG|nr:hypothetical protein M0811_12001 [Anaeramoeba ignava]
MNAKNEIDQTNRLSKKLGNYNAEELKSMFLQHREYGDVMFRFQSRVETEINKWEDYDLSSKFINFLQKLGVFENENYFLFLNDKTKTKNVLQITIIIAMMELIKTGECNAKSKKENHLKVKKETIKLGFYCCLLATQNIQFSEVSVKGRILDNENTTENTKQENKSIVKVLN